jgi:putative hemolysin
MSIWALLLQFGIVGAALGGTAFFSASEMALISASRIRVRQRAQAGAAAAVRALRLLRRREHLLILFLIGQAGLNVLVAAITTGLVDRVVPRGWQAALIATVGVTYVVVVAAEIVPKVIGQREGERFLMRHSRLLEFVHYLVLPLTHLLHLYILLLARLEGRHRETPFVTREELKVLVSESEVNDERGHREKRMLESILDFRETVAREVMIPMNQVIALEKGTTCEIWRAMVRRHGYTRIPVFEKRIDRVVGIVNIFDLLNDPVPRDTIDPYLREAYIVPDTKRIDHLMLELQKTRNPMAVVVDEFGACAGLVTVEDIVEEIVGEMADEHERSVRKIRRLASGSYIVEGLTDIDDLNQELQLSLPKGRFDTVGGLVLNRAGRVPREGERFTIHNITFEVLDADAYGIRVLKMTLPKEDPA